MTEGRNDGITEWRNRVTLYALAIIWRGHKNAKQTLDMCNYLISKWINCSFCSASSYWKCFYLSLLKISYIYILDIYKCLLSSKFRRAVKHFFGIHRQCLQTPHPKTVHTPETWETVLKGEVSSIFKIWNFGRVGGGS
jgi:hypothetical protein